MTSLSIQQQSNLEVMRQWMEVAEISLNGCERRWSFISEAQASTELQEILNLIERVGKSPFIFGSTADAALRDRYVKAFGDVKRLAASIRPVEDQSKKSGGNMTSLSVQQAPFAVRQLIDVADVGEKRTSADIQTIVNRPLSFESRCMAARLLDPSVTERTSSYSDLFGPQDCGYRRIPVFMSGIPAHLHQRVEAVWGNALFQKARYILIGDTNHDDSVQEDNIWHFINGCVEDGDVVLVEGTEMCKRIPSRGSSDSFFADIDQRDARGITEVGWDDMEMFHLSNAYTDLTRKFEKTNADLKACTDKLAAFGDSSISDEDERRALTTEFEQLSKEKNELQKKCEDMLPDFHNFCRARDDALVLTLDRYYKEKPGKRVYGSTGFGHISPMVLKKVGTRPVMIVILKGKPLEAGQDLIFDRLQNRIELAELCLDKWEKRFSENCCQNIILSQLTGIFRMIEMVSKHPRVISGTGDAEAALRKRADQAFTRACSLRGHCRQEKT